MVCSICEKVVLKESLSKHIQDIHEKSNKMKCEICSKILAGPFSLKEHITAIHDKIMKHQCSHCLKQFSHFSNMNRHIRLIHEKLVVKNKYVNCPTCQKCVQATSLKKHIRTIHEKAKDYLCSYCHKGFTQSFTLKVILRIDFYFTLQKSEKDLNYFLFYRNILLLNTPKLMSINVKVAIKHLHIEQIT